MEKMGPQVVSKPQSENEKPESHKSTSPESDETKSQTERLSQPLRVSVEDIDEPVPHLHLKTYLTVFSVCLIYIAQLINVVGAGAVS